MTIHTDTFPTTVAFAAGSPSLFLYRGTCEGEPCIFLSNIKDGSEITGVDITSLIPNPRALYAKLEEPQKVNLIDNKSFKHLLERLETKNVIAL